MNYEEARAFVRDNADNIVAINRSWNNSMYIYNDSCVVWNGSAQTVSLGTDFFDSYPFQVNKDTPAYAEWKNSIKKNQEALRQNRINMQAERYKHHGALAIPIAEYLETLTPSEREILDILLRVKRFRSPFRKSLCDRVLQYIQTPAERRKYAFPLSRKQQKALVF